MVETVLAPDFAVLSAEFGDQVCDAAPEAIAALSVLSEVLTRFQASLDLPGPRVSPALVASGIVTLEKLPAVLEALSDGLGIGRD